MDSGLRRVTALCAALPASIGLSALLGWVLNSDTLKGVAFGGITVKTNTALCLLLSGTALGLLAPEPTRPWRLKAGRLLAALVAVIALATLGEHLLGWELGIDEALFREAVGAAATSSPNRMGPPASICFPLLALALLLLDRRDRLGRQLGQAAALLPLALSTTSMLGYLFDARPLFGIARYTGIAFHTAVGFFLLALGILFARLTTGVMTRITAQDSGGLLIRRLLPAAILLPVVLGQLRVAGQAAGLYDVEFGRALLILSFIVLFSGLVIWTGGVVSAHALSLRAAEQLARDAALEAGRRKDAFLATLAHELRNPLAPIATGLELLRLDPQGAEATRAMMARQLAHVVRLVDDLLDVSRINLGRIELRRSRVRLQEVTEGALLVARPLIERQAHGLSVSVPDDLWIDGDDVRLVQILQNLLSNAAKYTPTGGRIELTAERAGSKIRVSVRDNGRGMDRETRSHVFEMFYQAGNRRAADGGLGVGLALAQRLAELHEGSIQADSEGEGRGSTFVLELPAAAPPARVAAVRAVPAAIPSRRRILVADDNADALESLALLLQAEGHEVRTARDGHEACELAESYRPDLALLDIGMPGCDGYEVARHVRALEWGSDVLLVALTGWGQSEDRSRSRDAGFDLHLVKPVTPEALRGALGVSSRAEP